MKILVHHYPDAEIVLLVQDNPNTHTAGSFYEVLSAEGAFELVKRFEFHYTPKKGRWLNNGGDRTLSAFKTMLGSQYWMYEETSR